MSQIDFDRGLAYGKNLATTPIPLSVVSYLNTLNATTATNSGLNNHLDRWPHVFPQAVSWFKFRWHNWYLPTNSAGLASNPGNSITFNSAYATYNGTRVALKSGGAPLAGQIVADGANIDSDPLHPIDFGLAGTTFPAGAVIWTTVDIALGGGVLCICGATVTGSTDLNSQVHGAVAQFYNPANTTVTINADGTVSTTGTAPANSTFGLRPICIGQLAVACDTWGIRADSTGFGYNDLTPSLAGTGWFQRALLLLGCPGFNMAITGGNALNGITDARVTACYALVNRAAILFGANDFSYPSGGQAITVTAMQTRVTNLMAQMKAAGIGKVAIAKILPVTTDSTNTWATEGNQVIKPGWGAGSYEDQYNQSLAGLGFDLVLPMAAARGATSPFVWRSNGTTGGGGVTVDGIHPAAYANKALAAEAAPLMLSIMDATPLPAKMRSQAQRGPFILVPSAAWAYNLLESDLLFCLDAEVASSLTQSGGVVSAWADIVSGLSFAASGSAQPSYSATGFNGARPGVTFNGTANYLEAAGIGPLPTTGPFEIWLLVNQANAATTDSILRTPFCWGGTGFDAIQINRQVNAGVNRVIAQIGSGTNNNDPSNLSQDFSGNCVVRLALSADDAQLDVNGSPSPILVAPTALNTTRARVGAYNATLANNFFQGTINCILVTNPLSEANRANLQAFLKARGGIS